MTKLLSVFSLLFYVCLFKASAGVFTNGSVYIKDGKATFVAGKLDKTAAAHGFYNDTMAKTGWGVLEIKSGYGCDSITDEEIMYAAGFLEGALTSNRIAQHYTNLYDYFFGKADPKLLNATQTFFNDQDAWMRSMIKQHASSSGLWTHAAYILAQYDGLVDGYGATGDKALPILAFQLLNGAGDMLDIRTALQPDKRPDWQKMSQKEAKQYVLSHSLCSALVKTTPGLEDLFMSHSSWFIYQATLRIYKHYNFNVRNPQTATRRLSFSSYPGFLESLDDFYLLDGKMVMLQTTNNVFNTSLYDLVTPRSVLAWQRVRMANMAAHNGKEWAEIINFYNSGTYNNQYMVIDLRRVREGVSLEDGALWLTEQIPGLVASGDVTPILRTGYWPSYNVPFFEAVYNASGYPQFVAQHGLGFSYQLAPRAEIFRRDQAGVQDIVDMMAIMRYNDYKEDKYSEGDPCNSICCRGDLNKENPRPDGCYDTKVTSLGMARNMTSYAVSGPTTSHGLPPFQWTSQFPVQHVGLPDVYDFEFQFMKPTL